MLLREDDNTTYHEYEDKIDGKYLFIKASNEEIIPQKPYLNRVYTNTGRFFDFHYKGDSITGFA